MNYGFYAAFLGMRARQRTLDVIANNIANASTER
jgi:flagellar basal body rod protein FlgG